MGVRGYTINSEVGPAGLEADAGGEEKTRRRGGEKDGSACRGRNLPDRCITYPLRRETIREEAVKKEKKNKKKKKKPKDERGGVYS